MPTAASSSADVVSGGGVPPVVDWAAVAPSVPLVFPPTPVPASPEVDAEAPGPPPELEPIPVVTSPPPMVATLLPELPLVSLPLIAALAVVLPAVASTAVVGASVLAWEQASVSSAENDAVRASTPPKLH